MDFVNKLITQLPLNETFFLKNLYLCTMPVIHPKYITDTAGKKLVVLPIKEFETIMEQLEDLDDIRLYDEAKKEDSGDRISLDEYLKRRQNKA